MYVGSFDGSASQIIRAIAAIWLLVFVLVVLLARLSELLELSTSRAR